MAGHSTRRIPAAVGVEDRTSGRNSHTLKEVAGDEAHAGGVVVAEEGNVEDDAACAVAVAAAAVVDEEAEDTENEEVEVEHIGNAAEGAVGAGAEGDAHMDRTLLASAVEVEVVELPIHLKGTEHRMTEAGQRGVGHDYAEAVQHDEVAAGAVAELNNAAEAAADVHGADHTRDDGHEDAAVAEGAVRDAENEVAAAAADVDAGNEAVEGVDVARVAHVLAEVVGAGAGHMYDSGNVHFDAHTPPGQARVQMKTRGEVQGPALGLPDYPHLSGAVQLVAAAQD